MRNNPFIAQGSLSHRTQTFSTFLYEGFPEYGSQPGTYRIIQKLDIFVLKGYLYQCSNVIIFITK